MQLTACTNSYRSLLLVLFSFWVLVVSALAKQPYKDNGDGTISDVNTGLMWVAQDNGYPINWPDAVTYCQNLHMGGHVDWRLPTLSELSGLYDPDSQNANGYGINKLITTTAQSCWSSETRPNEAGRFNFAYGKEYWLRQTYSGPTRVLCVRPLK